MLSAAESPGACMTVGPQPLAEQCTSKCMSKGWELGPRAAE